MARQLPDTNSVISPYMVEMATKDAQSDAKLGYRFHGAIVEGFYDEGQLSAPNWQVYQAAYQAELARHAAPDPPSPQPASDAMDHPPAP